MSYLNIPKEITEDFLRGQGDYTVAKIPHKLVNKPITTKVSNERWGVDLFDLTIYIYASRLLSGKTFARGIKNRENNNAHLNLLNAINDICVNGAHTFPHTIQVDGKFAVDAFCD